jgi:hypothetical protein
VEVVATTNEVVCCVECGGELLAERAELGYTYCTKDACQAKRHRGLVVTTVGMNKSGDTVVVGDAAEIRERGEAGEFARKDTGLGLGYRPLGAGSRRFGARRSRHRLGGLRGRGRWSRSGWSASTTTWDSTPGRSPSEPARARRGSRSPNRLRFASSPRLVADHQAVGVVGLERVRRGRYLM